MVSGVGSTEDYSLIITFVHIPLNNFSDKDNGLEIKLNFQEYISS